MKKLHLYCGHAFLREAGILSMMLLWVVLYSLLLYGRFRFEGVYYDVAYSSKFGDFCLILVISWAGHIMRQERFRPRYSMRSWHFHARWIIGSLLLGQLVRLAIQPKQWMDVWHASLIVPFFVYFIRCAVSVYWYCANTAQKIGGLILVLIWFIFVVYDIKTGRMIQRKYIQEHYPEWNLKNNSPLSKNSKGFLYAQIADRFVWWYTFRGLFYTIISSYFLRFT